MSDIARVSAEQRRYDENGPATGEDARQLRRVRARQVIAAQRGSEAERIIAQAGLIPCVESRRHPTHNRIWHLAMSAGGATCTDADRLKILEEIERITQP